MRVRANGPADVDEVWERYALPARWTQWAPQIRGVDCDVDRLARGARGRVYGPLGVYVAFVVEAWDDAARTWSWTASRGPVRVRLDHRVSTRADGAVQADLRLSGPAPVVLGYLPIAQLALHRLVR